MNDDNPAFLAFRHAMLHGLAVSLLKSLEMLGIVLQLPRHEKPAI